MTTTRTRTETLDEIDKYNGNQLAYRAECSSPDGPESPGALYLAAVRDEIIEAHRYTAEHGETLDSDDVYGIVDRCIPVYTHALWQTFVDLGAYQEEIELEGLDDVAKVAPAALYEIGERLASQLHDMIEESQ